MILLKAIPVRVTLIERQTETPEGFADANPFTREASIKDVPDHLASSMGLHHALQTSSKPFIHFTS